MSADYPPALWVPADPTNYSPGRHGPVTRVVIHVTDGHPDAGPVAEMWQQPRHGSSAHFVVGQSGEVVQAVSVGDRAWHAHAANADSVGVEHCARSPREWGPNDAGLAPSDALYRASAELVACLCRQRGIVPVLHKTVLGHAEADPATTHSDCPTGAWDWSVYGSLLVAAYNTRSC